MIWLWLLEFARLKRRERPYIGEQTNEEIDEHE